MRQIRSRRRRIEEEEEEEEEEEGEKEEEAKQGGLRLGERKSTVVRRRGRDLFKDRCGEGGGEKVEKLYYTC